MCWFWDYSRSNKYDCNDNNCINVEVSGSEGEKVKDSVAETVPLSHLLITSTTTLSLPARIPYSNNINNTINVIIITYPTHNSITIVTYYSTTYDNNSIYFTTITLVDITISATSNYSNVFKITY